MTEGSQKILIKIFDNVVNEPNRRVYMDRYGELTFVILINTNNKYTYRNIK